MKMFCIFCRSNPPCGLARMSQDLPVIGNQASLNYDYKLDDADESNTDIRDTIVGGGLGVPIHEAHHISKAYIFISSNYSPHSGICLLG